MKNILGKNLKRLRLRAELQQDELAGLVWPQKSLKVGQVQISKYEAGRQTPRQDVQEALAQALKCTVADLWREPSGDTSRLAPPSESSDLLSRPEGFDAWAEDQVLELARRAMAQVRVVVVERDQAREEAADLRLEVERLRATLARLSRENHDLRMQMGILDGSLVQTRATDSAPPPTIQEPGENDGSKKDY